MGLYKVLLSRFKKITSLMFFLEPIRKHLQEIKVSQETPRQEITSHSK